MKQLWVSEHLHYDGSQLRPLFAYMQYQILGNSIISWRGSCDVDNSHMVDGEDLLQGAQICGADMLHFIIEMFDRELFSGVLLQRLMASIIKDLVHEFSDSNAQFLTRDGDDLYWGDRKLSISISSKSAVSTQIHFAVNITNDGTPVKTCALEDMAIEPEKFAVQVMDAVVREWESVTNATRKVKPL